MAVDAVSLRRAWRRSIAGKLQIAFGLIVALTVGAILLALLRFQEVGVTMDHLTQESLPAFKLALELETKTAEISSSAVLLTRSNYEPQRASRMNELNRQLTELEQLIDPLRIVIGKTASLDRLAELLKSLNEDVRLLDQSIRQKVTAGPQVEKLTEAADPAADRLEDLVKAVGDEQAGDGDLAGLKAVTDARIEVNEIASILNRIASLEAASALAPRRDGFRTSADRLSRSLDALAERLGDSPRTAELRRAFEALVAIGRPEAGIFDQRAREIAAIEAARQRQTQMQAVAWNLTREVGTLLMSAELQSYTMTELTRAAIDESSVWLVGIGAASAVLAALILWLFVTRYIVRRLTALSTSMLAVAGGDLDAGLPKTGADELGDMSRALAVFRDNAREIRVAREEAERAREEAEEASRTKSAFLANMSHELRTPLNAIIGYSEMLLEDATDRGDGMAMADLGKIETAGKHLLGLINDILDLSKIEAGRVEIYLEPVETAKLVAELSPLVEPLLTKNGNRLAIDCPADLGIMNTDVTKLRQSLLNLLSNAAKFTKNGAVSLVVRRTPDEAGTHWLSFAVKDSGIGMTPEQVGRLFQAFMQADSSTTRNFGGTGLGLTITRHFCTMLGGSVHVDSVAGEGSTFTIVLPAAGPNAASAAAAAGKPVISGAQGGATILVVDDDPVVHDLLDSTLTKEGYRVVHARNGNEAVQFAREVQPDAITLDVMMPQVDGWMVLSRLKSDPVLARIPIVMLTMIDNRSLGFSLGASEFMTKPIDRARLAALLARFVGQRGDRTVLVVDDDENVRGILRAAIEGAGMRAAEAENGRAALDAIAAGLRPNLVLLDLMMPEVDGFACLDAIRADPALADLAVVVLTAKDLTEAEKAFLAARTTHVFAKGAQSVESLGRVLARIIPGESAAAA